MDMHRALRPARRARGIEPETRLVRMRRRGFRGRRFSEQRGERMLFRGGAGDDDFGPRFRQLRQCRPDDRQHRRRYDHRSSPAVRQHEGEFARRQLSVDRDRDDPSLDCAEKRGRKVDRVVEAEEDALLGVNAQSAHDIGKPAHPFGELGIAVAPVIIDEGGLRAPSGREVPLDEISSGIICRRALAAHRPFSLLSGLGHNISHLLRSSSVPHVATAPRTQLFDESLLNRVGHDNRPGGGGRGSALKCGFKKSTRCAVGGTTMVG